MSENTIFVRKYSVDATDSRFEINRKEVQRYAGYFRTDIPFDETIENLLNEVIEELQDKLAFKVCYRRMDLAWDSKMPQLPFECESKDLAKFLEGSSELVMFAATIGLDIDRLIAKYQRLSPTKALLMQALGAERVERLCDVFCDEIKEQAASEGLTVTGRYSPGYGDLPLEKQIDFFKLLDCNRQIGISLNESLLMTPSKSVTALFGIGHCAGEAVEHKCSLCTKTDCEYRKCK